MADMINENEPPVPENIDAAVSEAVGEPVVKRAAKVAPVYRMVGKSKIPVSKSLGKVWKSRKQLATSSMKDVLDAWNEAIRYYENDQSAHRDGASGKAGNTRYARSMSDKDSETENIVFANVTTMTASLYSRNPQAEFTSNAEEMESMANRLEDLINAIVNKKSSPGVNLKPKAKRGVVVALLTNRAWLKLGWTFKEDSSDTAYKNMQELAKELEKATDAKEIETIEGKLMALEASADLLQAPGPYAVLKMPHDILVDPSAKEVDLSDARWVMECDHLPTAYLVARFAEKKDGEYMMVFAPTHVMKVMGASSENGTDTEQVEFSLFKEDEHDKYGFGDKDSFDRSKHTKVWWVWDKITRRLFLFNDADWTWPIWVWDDPYQLDSFFPYYPLSFFDGAKGQYTKGEVSYYLDQQDAINEMASEKRRARRWARRNVFFNKNLTDSATVEAVLKGDDGTARGLDIPEGMKLNDVIGSIVPPSMAFKELFDNTQTMQAIDRISSVNEVMRGAQFKTNTNSTAVNATTSAATQRIDEKSDQIEDWIGGFCWGLAQLCLQFMKTEDVDALIGKNVESPWRNMTPQEIAATLSMEVVGGSTQKPTSSAKKQEAMELGQVLGQFANVSPVVVKVMLNVMERAFDEVVITDEDWKMIDDALAQVLQEQQQSQSVPGAESAAPVDATQSGGTPDVQQALSQIPPKAKVAAMQAIQAGVPPAEAIKRVLQQTVTKQ